jgi:hypothetical protein
VTNDVALPERPPSVDRAIYAIYLQIAATVISGALLWTYTAYYRADRIKVNADLKATDKNKHVPYTADQIAHDVHSLRVSGLVTSLILAVLFGFIAMNLRSGRSIARWIYIIASVYTGGALRVLVIGTNEPGGQKIVQFIGGVACLAAIGFLLSPPSRRFFAEVKAQRVPPMRAGMGGAGGARPAGFGGLFSPRPRPGAGGTGAGGASGARPAGFGGLFSPRPRPGAGGTGAGPTQPGTSGTSAGKSARNQRPATTRPASGAGSETGSGTGSSANSGLAGPPPGNQARAKAKSRGPAPDATGEGSGRGKGR